MGHTGLTHRFYFFCHSGTLALSVKNLKGGLDQYGTECFARLIFATIRKSVGLKGLKQQHIADR